MLENTVVFALSSSRGLAEKICKELGIELGKCTVNHFADGEILVELNESVRGKNVYFVQSTNNPVNDNLMELLIGMDACKRASAASITTIIPYYGYARQDRKAKPRQPITSKLVASLLEKAGAGRVVTVDLHATQIQGYFDIPADDIAANQVIAEHFLRKEDFNMEDVVVVSPDHGGTVRARRLAAALNVPLAIIDKRRPKPNVAEAMNILGDVDGKKCIIIDDMVDTAGTLCAGIKMLKDKGAKEVYATCSHGILSGPAIERLKSAGLAEFVSTDTIDQTEHQKDYPEMVVLTMAPLLASLIAAVENQSSLGEALSHCFG
ncbi:MAG: ribose-phosphate pyrophosphokinase [Bacillota bacterium]|nr:ribose-phosphate pyrophosphokinase [Bacillota bacterium]